MAGEAVYSSRWSVMDGASPSFSGSSVRWDFNNGDTLRKRQPRLRTPALRGTRARIAAQGRKGPYDIGGSLTIDPSPKFLGWGLVKVMGGGSETAPAFADRVPEFAMLADRGSATASAFGNCYKYLGLKMNRLAISGRGGLIECTIDVLGKTSTPGQTFAGAALGTTTAYSPYQHADVTCAFGTAAAAVLRLTEFDLIFSNGLTPRLGTGTLSADEIIEGDRVVTFTGAAVCDVAGLEALLWVDADTSGGLSLVNAGLSTTFSFNNMEFDLEDIQPRGQEFIIPVSATVTGTTGVELTVTNDVTP